MSNSTLIFIPDISGFTKFVNETAIEHSGHIISELLEIVISANDLDFKISEIEGDAVLFYKRGNIPSINEIFKQSKEMFLRFHSFLNTIDKTNVCQCGACKTASQLSLKFITHVGPVEEISIKGFNKLIGSDLILAHRLLKNSIPSNEYLLFSESYFDNYNPDGIKLEDWAKLEINNDNLENFGKIKTQFINFNPLLKLVPQYVESNSINHDQKEPGVFLNIKAPILLVHEALTDVNAKYEYVKNIKKIITSDKINRVSASHTCVFDNLEIHFVTKNNTVKKEQITYSEEAELNKGFKFITDFELKENNNTTDLSVYFIISHNNDRDKKNKSIFNTIKDYLFLKFIIFNSKKGMNDLKNYCESKYQKTLTKNKTTESL